MRTCFDEFQFVANLLSRFPSKWPSPWSPLNNLNESCLIETISRNKVEFDFGKKIEIHDMFRDRFFTAFPRMKIAYQELNAKIARDSAAFIQIRGQLSKKNIEFILIKSDGSFPYETDNLDILIRPERLRDVAQLLENAGYSERVRIREPHKFLFRKSQAFEELPLHIHTRIEWEGIQFIDSDKLWRRREISKDCGEFSVPSPEDCVLITSAHLFFENHEMKLADLLRINSRIRKTDLDWDYIFDHARKLHWDDAFVLTLLLANLAYKNLYGRRMLQQQVLARITETINYRTNLFLKVLRTSDSEVFPLKIPYFVSALFLLRRIFRDPSSPLTARLRCVAWIAYDITKRRAR